MPFSHKIFPEICPLLFPVWFSSLLSQQILPADPFAGSFSTTPTQIPANGKPKQVSMFESHTRTNHCLLQSF
jgi:hypothetical protein